MLFEYIKTEKDVDALKRKIMKTPELHEELLSVRKNMDFYKNVSFEKKTMPTNAEILALYKKFVRDGRAESSHEIELLLRKIKTKSNSGVAVVSLLTKPYMCPGNCLYCPTEAKMPKSYLSREPAAARALLNDFDPYKQVTTRLKALCANGHPVDKIEVIVIGGTWSAYPRDYQEEFITNIFAACNDFDSDSKRQSKYSLDLEQEKNERARSRVIGISIETRPDSIHKEEIRHLRKLGVTRVELGVQNLDDEVLAKNNRTINQAQIIEATSILRYAGFKIVYHMMPNLPFSTPEKDVNMFQKLFEDENYQPDMLKIYPCVVLESAPLYDLWKKGGFTPYTKEELMKILISIKKKIPKYVRIMRIIRDIPSDYVYAGNKTTNLRQDLMKAQDIGKWRCKCIRCREIREEEVYLNELDLNKIEYVAAGGVEIFLSFERKKDNMLASFLRLRLSKNNSAGLDVLDGSALVRELHTYGRLVRLGEGGGQAQHRGLGRRLLEEAENIAKNKGFGKIAVISGVGVRDYYRKLGYRLDGTYMVKLL